MNSRLRWITFFVGLDRNQFFESQQKTRLLLDFSQYAVFRKQQVWSHCAHAFPLFELLEQLSASASEAIPAEAVLSRLTLSHFGARRGRTIVRKQPLQTWLIGYFHSYIQEYVPLRKSRGGNSYFSKISSFFKLI